MQLTATSQMGEQLPFLNQASIPAHQASLIAVQGFWQLVRVSTRSWKIKHLGSPDSQLDFVFFLSKNFFTK